MVQRFFIMLLLFGSYTFADMGATTGREDCRPKSKESCAQILQKRLKDCIKFNRSGVMSLAVGMAIGGSLGTLYGESLKDKFLNRQADN